MATPHKNNTGGAGAHPAPAADKGGAADEDWEIPHEIRRLAQPQQALRSVRPSAVVHALPGGGPRMGPSRIFRGPKFYVFETFLKLFFKKTTTACVNHEIQCATVIHSCRVF